MPRCREPQQQQSTEGDGEGASNVLTPYQRAVEFLRRAMRSETHWRPSMALAKCLGVGQGKLQLTNDKEAMTNLVWATVSVLIHFASRLTDVHELWYEMAGAALQWLYEQPHFVENRDDLIVSACAMLNVRDPSSMTASAFPEPKDEDTKALEAALGDWKICYLDEPPYSMYYWNEKTNQSTWRNPIEAAQLEQERLEKKKQREQLLGKVLPMRVKINRTTRGPPNESFCDECLRSAKGAQTKAVVHCKECRSYFCADCCDNVHSARDKVVHIEASFQFTECMGFKGFPKR